MKKIFLVLCTIFTTCLFLNAYEGTAAAADYNFQKNVIKDGDKTLNIDLTFDAKWEHKSRAATDQENEAALTESIYSVNGDGMYVSITRISYKPEIMAQISKEELLENSKKTAEQYAFTVARAAEFQNVKVESIKRKNVGKLKGYIITLTYDSGRQHIKTKSFNAFLGNDLWAINFDLARDDKDANAISNHALNSVKIK